MHSAYIDSSPGFDGEVVVLACFDLDERERAAAAHAVAVAASERYRMAELGADDVLELRELTALADDLAQPGARTVVLRPARLSALRDALQQFVETRTAAEWIREADRAPLAVIGSLLDPLADLCCDALRAALQATDAATRSS